MWYFCVCVTYIYICDITYFSQNYIKYINSMLYIFIYHLSYTLYIFIVFKTYKNYLATQMNCFKFLHMRPLIDYLIQEGICFSSNKNKVSFAYSLHNLTLVQAQ